MVSPELLRRHPLFAPFNVEQLRRLAMIADENSAEVGEILFHECDPAQNLYLLLEGEIDLFYTSQQEFHPTTSKEFLVGEVNPGEVFSISAMIPPYVLNASARATKPSRYVIINGEALRKLMDEDSLFGYAMMVEVTRVVMERLAYTRVQLAAAWAE